MSFNLLSLPIKRYVREQGWEELRPIQNAAISKILSTDLNYILSSRTASGKTEAAFLPILSTVDFAESGVQVLYVSPLKALINDQFLRVEELCRYLDVPVTKWHGDAVRSAKDALVKRPSGIVLITPESLEAMFVNRPYNVRNLFSNLKFVVIDEIHSFIGTNRGIQLKSILSRLEHSIARTFRVIGLSATIANFDEAKAFTGDAAKTKVLVDTTARDVEAEFRFFESTSSELSIDLIRDLYDETQNRKVLIFPNSRGRTEEIAVKLKRISDRERGHSNYFSHHSSINKDVREYVEFFAKNSRSQNFAISCTSTLELGIDIGAVDEVVQVDATNSIASLIQRVGRSGRTEKGRSKLVLYATDEWSSLQSIACWSLYRSGLIEQPEIIRQPFDILLHQALSTVKSSSGMDIETLVSLLSSNFAFQEISRAEIVEIVDFMIQTDLLERIRHEVIVGLSGEKLVNSKEFYTVFTSEENFKVVQKGVAIGELPFTPQIIEGENVFLAARIWKIVFVDFESKKIEVIRATDGKRPTFLGGGSMVDAIVRKKMLELLFSSEREPSLTEASFASLEKLRREFAVFDIGDVEFDRPMLVKQDSVTLFTFVGTKLNRTIKLMLDLAGLTSTVKEFSSSIEIVISKADFLKRWPDIIRPLDQISAYLCQLIIDKPAVMSFSKWGQHLPIKSQSRLMLDTVFDFEGTLAFHKSCRWVENRDHVLKGHSADTPEVTD